MKAGNAMMGQNAATRKWTQAVCRIVACALVVAVSGAGPAPAVQVSSVPSKPAATTPQLHSASIVLHKNPHLKGVDAVATSVRPTVGKKVQINQVVAHRTLQPRWDYHAWMVLHRGLGTIRGLVHNGGAPVSSARVVLRKPGGRSFVRVSMKHITFTDGGGDFLMTAVRAGRYRVVAFSGKLKGHSQVVVHPGSMSSVSINI
jgi:hypothetical protein